MNGKARFGAAVNTIAHSAYRVLFLEIDGDGHIASNHEFIDDPGFREDIVGCDVGDYPSLVCAGTYDDSVAVAVFPSAYNIAPFLRRSHYCNCVFCGGNFGRSFGDSVNRGQRMWRPYYSSAERVGWIHRVFPIISTLFFVAEHYHIFSFFVDISGVFIFFPGSSVCKGRRTRRVGSRIKITDLIGPSLPHNHRSAIVGDHIPEIDGSQMCVSEYGIIGAEQCV